MLRGDYLAMIGSSSAWSRTQDKLFERALVLFPEDTPDRWERIATEVPGKDPTEVRDHYEVLVHDVGEIDSGRVAVPSYTEDSFTPEWWVEEGPSQISFGGGKGKGAENERKKGVPWTEEEHRNMGKETGGVFLEMQWFLGHRLRWPAMLRNTTCV
eukprot:TRINITY_DN5545_c0_g1_i3.p1 TRINITY_DN5545_c0_g1~~TRINITY_DN5545_c0_g1_i3.p1  ORF type:complete len:156 (+),score=20.72 TRINITY_DN5545_c0_g1_i3:101-568(+)